MGAGTSVSAVLSALLVVSTVVTLALHRFAPAATDDRIVAFLGVREDQRANSVVVESADTRRQREVEERLDRLQRLSQRRVQQAKDRDASSAGTPHPLLELRTYPPRVQELRERWRRRKEQDERVKRERGSFPTYNLSELEEVLLRTFMDPSTSPCVRVRDKSSLSGPRGWNSTERAAVNRTSQQDYVGVCVHDVLTPPFVFSVPRFLPDTDHAELFARQPENRAAVLPNFTDWSYKTCVTIPRNHDATTQGGGGGGCIVGRVEAHDVWSFQHFHDIGLPLALQHRQLFDALQRAQARAGCEPYPVRLSYDPPHNSDVLREEWSLLGFPTNQSSSYGDVDKACGQGHLIATTIVKGMSAHPSHVRELRNRLFPRGDDIPLKRHKVVWISRSRGPDTGSHPVLQRRQISNEPEVLERLRSKLEGFEVLNPMRDGVETVADLRLRLGDACLIAGVHGGQMYNQFFAGTGTSVLELLPVSDDPAKRGWYHGQSSPDARPILAHRSIWFNANLIGQPYWRIYVATPDAKSFNLTSEVVDQILQVAEAAGCT